MFQQSHYGVRPQFRHSAMETLPRGDPRTPVRSQAEGQACASTGRSEAAQAQCESSNLGGERF